MYQFSVTPSDQRLFLKGVELEGLDKSLAELSVTPNSIIVLRVSSFSSSVYALAVEYVCVSYVTKRIYTPDNVFIKEDHR